MINQTAATDYLLHDMPELSQELGNRNEPTTIYKTLQAFIRLTCKKVQEHNFKAARQCFNLADKLHQQGNVIVRCAVENVFVFSMDAIFRQASNEKIEIRGLVPGSLYSVYMRQVMYGGC
jgi:hypothetical protein